MKKDESSQIYQVYKKTLTEGIKPVKIRPLTKPEPDNSPVGGTIYIVTSSTLVKETTEDGDWYREYACEVKYVTKNKPTTWDFKALEVSPEVFMAHTIYLVCVYYRTGDSFGFSTGNLDVYKVYDNPEEARALAAEIEADKHQPSNNNYPVWRGYFEEVEYTDVVAMRYDR